MTSPASGRADFQAYASWLGTPDIIPATNYPVGTTIIADLSLSNFSALNVLAFGTTGSGTLQFQFFTDATKSQSIDVYQYVITGNNALNLTIPMITPFVEVSVIVLPTHALLLTTILTPNNIPVVRPTYPGQVRNFSANAQTLGPSGSILGFPQYIIAGQTYAFFQPADSAGKLDFTISAVGADAQVQYELMKFAGPTGPTGFTFLSPCQPIQIQVKNNDAASAHTYNYTVQQIGN